MLQKRRISGWFWNIQISQSFTRNNCPAQTTPGSVVYTVPANTHKARTQTAANALAQADINANGQNNANTIGECIPYPGNVQLSSTLTRTNCPAQTTPGSATYIVYANTYFAPTQAAANALAQTDIDTNAQTWVNNNAACTPWTLKTIRPFTGYGNNNWIVPVTSGTVDVFLVGSGGNGNQGGGGGGYTKTFLNISVTQGQSIPVFIGMGGTGNRYAEFLNSTYRADGGGQGTGSVYSGYSGGSGGGGHGWRSGVNPVDGGAGGSNGGNGGAGNNQGGGSGQGTTTRDFGEPTGLRNAGGGGGGTSLNTLNGGAGGISDYSNGSGTSSGTGNSRGRGGGGYGGGGGGNGEQNTNSGAGGDGTCMIRYYGP
jgi:hypothetical protein